LADDHKTVLLSIMATTVTGIVLFLATIVASGGVSIAMFVKWVLPVFISALSLGIF
jgi:fatty acid desaturase